MELEEFGSEGAEKLQRIGINALGEEEFTKMLIEDSNNYPKLFNKNPREFGVYNLYTLCLKNGTIHYVFICLIAYYNKILSLSSHPLILLLFSVLLLFFLWFTFLKYLLLTRGDLINALLTRQETSHYRNRTTFHSFFLFTNQNKEEYELCQSTKVDYFISGLIYPILFSKLIPEKIVTLKSIQNLYTLNKQGDWNSTSYSFRNQYIALIFGGICLAYFLSNKDIQMFLR
ncbi:hypothetical protein MJH12_07310 [bacterium]|nr:hypothetical protein [bacterium]